MTGLDGKIDEDKEIELISVIWTSDREEILEDKTC